MKTENSVKNTENVEFISKEKNKVEKGVLYLVATPIGNLSDMSERALKVLSEVDFVAAEDTRNSGKLLSVFGISKSMTSYFEHNKRQKGEEIVRRLQNGESCALITDAGTPAVSDPGEDIVRLCADAGIRVSSVPGCCAAVTALSISGLPTSKFVFEGFLSATASERREALESLKGETRTVIIYEAPHKLRRTLDDIFSILGDRKIALCRELTKINEEVIRTTVSDAIKLYSEKEPRGEYVLIIGGADRNEIIRESFWAKMSINEHIEYYINEQGMKKMDAIKTVAKDRGVPKSEIYNKTI
ncbi:MAG: 16S rRNA (cytidine(1402)-2'-O)-methyltransferase [Ruminococcaceae bacterium]|nr:16S rRNA (cytidine(1402)-2'-O)-methyltransferase [Oscillospiraceae bacterium]